MIKYSRGDVVLVKFLFSDEKGIKLRPALIVSNEDYNASRQEIIMAAITSNVERCLIGDTRLKYWKEANLLHPSLVTAILRTIKQDMIERRLGKLSVRDLQVVEKNLRDVLGF